MSEITLSKAVRSNLLNLQSTASLLGKSQERLSSGLRVNSALDNPTNFFTAQGLNSRANDLSQLSDAVSNAVQTVAAADKGITAITKLVESAQATARQALQTSATVSTDVAATAATFTAGAFSTLDVSGTTAGPGQAAVAGTSTITPIVLAGAGHAAAAGTSTITPIVLAGATNAEATAGSVFSSVDASGGDLTFDVNGETVTLNAAGGTAGVYDLTQIAAAITSQVGAAAGVTAQNDGSGHLQITSTGTAGSADAVTVNTFTGAGFDATDLGFAGATVSTNGTAAQDLTFEVNGDTVTLAGGSTYAGADIATAINTQVGSSASVNATYGAGGLTITSTGTAGASDSVTVDTFSTGTATQLGFAGATASANGTAAQSLTFEVNGDTVTLAGGSTYAGADIATAINTQVGSSASVNATYGAGGLTITSTGTAGASDSVTVDTFSTGSATQLGFAGATATDNGEAATVADSLTFSVSVNGTSHAITIDDAAVDTYNTAHSGANLDSSALSAANVASLINDQAGVAVASVTTGGALAFTSTTTGSASTVAVTGFTSAGTPTGSTGVANNNDTGTALVPGSGANPKRAELVETYNDLLGQIDALAKDSGFNGVNLLNGDDLSVLFNEDGTSSLEIEGVTNSSTSLGLAALGTTGFDTNDAINDTLDDLKAGIETLRSQSAKFGANLSVVETRQEFTKNMINVLQTGAANLTLADTNEEAANVLALQTRQQLSSTALSLASQADQNVLRLF